jgi:sirohydrochlorin ferrochelatase
VQECYLTAATPSFGEALEFAVESRSNQVFIIPYLMFTGLLMQSIENSIKKIQKKGKQRIILCRYLGYHPKIEQAISERIHEVSGEGAYVSNYA